MKKHNCITGLIVFSVLMFAFSTTVGAANIFNEDPETFSYSRYLPIVVGGTMIIEAVIIILLSDIKRIVNVSYTVLVANITSFLIPRFVLGIMKNSIFFTGMFVTVPGARKWLIAAGYFAFSLVVELPIVYFMLKPFTKKRVRLMFVSAAANLLSTIAVVVFEIFLYNAIIK